MLEIKQESDEIIRQSEAAETEAAINKVISRLDDQQIDVKSIIQLPSGANNCVGYSDGHATRNGGTNVIESRFISGVTNGGHGVGDGELTDDLGEEPLVDERDIQIYEELMARVEAEVVLKEPIASRITVDERIKKINCNLEDETNCQMIILNDEPVNNAWSTFRYPRNLDDFLEIIFTWADNHLNGQNWPQDQIVTRLKAFTYSLRYSSFQLYTKAILSYLLVLFYDRFKKDTNNLIKSSTNKDEGISAAISKLINDDQWSEIIFKLSSDSENLKFGFCCVLTVIASYTSSERKYFGTILGKQTVKENGSSVTYLTVKALEFAPTTGDKLAVRSLFRINHIYTSAESLFKLESSEYSTHYSAPTLASLPSGVTLRFEDDALNLEPFDCDAVLKAVDTFSLASPEVSPICCLDFRETGKTLKDLTDIAVQILIFMRQVPIDTRWIGLDIPTLVICNDEDILSTLHEKFKKNNFPIYRLNRQGEPINLRDKIPRIGKSLAKALSNVKYLEDAKDYKELASKWEFVDEGIFASDEQETKFSELIEMAKVFAIRNSAVLLGNVYDIANDTVLNSSYCQFPTCIILGASSIPEVFTLPLMKYGCEKIVLIDQECTPWPENKSMFTRLVSLYEVDHSMTKGAKCCVVTAVKRKLKLPNPPIVSRHKLIEKNAKESQSTLPSLINNNNQYTCGYNPEQRKNPLNRLPYCPKQASSILDAENATQTP